MSKVMKLFLLLFVLILIFISYVYWDNQRVVIRKEYITLDNLPEAMEGFTILHVSDLHSRSFGDKQNKLLKLLAKENFNIVVYTGDMVDKDKRDFRPLQNLATGISKLNKVKGQFYVTGNHEHWARVNIEKMLEPIEVTNLNNGRVRLYREKSISVWLLGVDEPIVGRPAYRQVLEGIKAEDVTIMLAHSPIMEIAKKLNLDLVLSGHTHGGQIRAPFIGALVAPNQGLLPKYDKGLYQEDKTKLYISSGLGYSNIPLRLFNPSEIVLITLKSDN